MRIIVEWDCPGYIRKHGLFDHLFHTPNGTMACVITGTSIEEVPFQQIRIVNGFTIIDGKIKKAGGHKKKDDQLDLDFPNLSADTSGS